MSETTTLTREEMIEEYIRAQALDIVLKNLNGPREEYAPLSGLVDYDELHDLTVRSRSGGTLDTLWPNDEDVEQVEYLLASVREEILVARIFAALAENPDYLRARAAYFLELAERRAQELAQAKGGDDA